MYISHLSGPFCISKSPPGFPATGFSYTIIRFIGNCFHALTGVVFPLPSSILYF
ncbi:hypothetical protein HMPREF1548_04459 [Clostridium sp. KLE 1755]|nr:hypothetical protein HMPREF1548_04459 [Clostridium sp. KLE 1755]